MRKLLTIFLAIFMAVSVFAAAPTAGGVGIDPFYQNEIPAYTAADFSITTGFTGDPAIIDCYYTLNGTDWVLANWSDVTMECTQIAPSQADGANLTVNMKANNGEETEAIAIAVTVDATPPTTTEDITDDWYTEDIIITLTCDDTSGSGCAGTNYCIGLIDCTPDTTYTSEITHSTEGTNYIRFNSTDKIGNEETPVLSQVLKLDKSGPTYDNIVPANGTYATSLTVSFDVTDAGIGVEETSIAIDLDNTGSVVVPCTGTDVLSCSYIFSSLTEESHALKISASDTMTVPNATETTVTFTYDVSNPSVSAYDPTSGATDVLINENVSVTFDESMDTTSVQNAFTMYETATPANTVPTESANFSWSGNTLTFNPTDLLTEEIEYTIEIANTATDLAGNPLNGNPFTFSFTTLADNDKPETEYPNASNDWKNSNISITLTCSDNGGSGCKEIKYCIDSGNSCTPGDTYSSTISHSTEGTRYIRYRSEDYSGNLEDADSQILKLDKQNPNTPTLNTANARNEEVYLDWDSVSDNGDSGIKHYKIYRNGSEIYTTSGTDYTATGLSNGTSYNFKIRAVDNAGNESSYSNEKSATPTTGSNNNPVDDDPCGDTTEPTLDWIFPKNGQKFNKGIIELKVNATDNGTMSSVRFYNELKYVGNITSPTTGNTWIYEWDASEKELGDYTIRAMARDACGNATNKEITITLTDEKIVDATIDLENADNNEEDKNEPIVKTTATTENEPNNGAVVDETSAVEETSAFTMFANLLGSEYVMLGLGLLILAAVALFVVNYMRSGKDDSDDGFSNNVGLGAAYRKADKGGFGSSRSRQSEFLSDLASKIRNEKPKDKNPRWAYKN